MNCVDNLTFDNNVLTIQLTDETCHTYNMNDIITKIRKVKNREGIRNTRHFTLIIKKDNKKVAYDILVDDSDNFLAFYSLICNDSIYKKV